MVYDYDLKYESEIEVTVDVGTQELNDMLEQFNMPRMEKTGRMTIDHKVSVTDSPILPQQSFIDATRENILNCMKETFMKEKTSMNVKVIDTNFIGIVNLKEKE